MKRLAPRTADAALAGLMLAISAVEALTGDTRGSGPVYGLVLVVMAGTLLLRRTAPVPAAAIWAAGAVIVANGFASPDQASASFLGLLMLAYAAGRHADGRTAALAFALLTVGTTTIYATYDAVVVGDYVFPPLIAAAVLGLGSFVRSRVRLSAELLEASLLAEEARDRAADDAAADERRRIAREMHDVVAHSVSVMVVQAGGARRILATDPGRASEAAERIEATGREALAEMRRLLGIIGGGGEARLGPAPTLAQAEPLVARARDAGLDVHLVETGERRELPAGLDLAAYRILQEALTNALRHAGRVRTDVRVDWGDAALAVEVRNAAGTREDAPPSGGHGLVGMEERVRLYGGTLCAAPEPDGGFRVHARLPLTVTDSLVPA